MKKLIEELKRRNVIKASLAYLVIAWVLLQVLDILLPMLSAPVWLLSTLTLIMAIGFPIWIIVSWVYDITPQGIEKTTKESGNELATQATNKRLNVFIIASLSIAVIVLTLKITNVFENSNNQYAIAVLPFDNIKVDEGNEYLSESFALDVRSYISKVSNLNVTDFYSAKRYKDSNKTNSVIGNELGVSYILRGTVKQIGNNLSITVALINTKTGETEWDETYDEIIQNKVTLNIQQQVSQKIVKWLRVKITPQEEKNIQRKPTENVQAQYYFTKGREAIVKRGTENKKKSIKYFQQAVALDSNYAEAYAEVAHSYYLLGNIGDETDDDTMSRINHYLEKALKLNPNAYRAYAVKAMMIQNEDWEKGGEYFEKAISINPNDASVHMQYALNLRWRPEQDIENSLKHFKKAQLLEPFNKQKNAHLISALLFSGKIEEAEEHFHKMKFLFSKNSQIYTESYIKAYKNKDWTEALRFFESEIEKDPNNSYLYSKLGQLYTEILNDDNNYIKYAKKAYEIDSIESNYASAYVHALIEGKKFETADKLMQSKNFKSLRDKRQQLSHLWNYYYHQEKYEKAQDVLKDSLAWGETVSFFTAQLLTHAQLGDRKYVEKELREFFSEYFDWQKAITYAVLKERDSMYHYLDLNTQGLVSGLRNFNFRSEFDPYRKEERYKALLRKHYLPITHWNEE